MILGVGHQALAQSSAVADRIVVGIDEARRITLVGNTHPLAQSKFDRGVAPSTLPMERMLLLLSRSPEQQADLETLLAEQVNPDSPGFHAWLSPAQFGERFGPSDADLSLITSWLTGHGFAIGSISAGKTVLEFSGTAGQVEQAFHTQIHRYSIPANLREDHTSIETEHWANASDPQIPAALAPVIAGVVSLNDFGLRPMHRTLGPVIRHAGSSHVTPQFDINYSGAEYYGLSPYDFATMYNVAPLWTAGITGAGETIGIVGQTNIKTADVAAFRAAFGLPALAPAIIVNGAMPANSAGDEEESDLDVEWSGAVARNATIQFVTSASTTSTAGVFLSAEYIVDKKSATILSMSYGGCEEALGTSGNTFINSLWQQAASEGISVFVAAGDSGSAGCDSHDGTPPFAAEYGLQVNGTASTPYNVAVGGTDLADYNPLGGTNTFSTYWATTNSSNGSSLKKYVPEVVWNDSCAIGTEAVCNNSSNSNFVRVDGGSGGKSSCTTVNTTTGACSGGYAKPSWQAGTGVPADGKRDIPDLSLFAGDGARGTFYLICDSDVAPCTYSNSTDAIALAVGGTSASAPAMAGIQALVNQKLKAAQGNVNPTLYSLAKKETLSSCNSTSGSGSSCIFNDVTAGNNAMPCYDGTANCTVSTAGDEYGILPGYAAGTGFDLASGLGSVNANNLVNQWPGGSVSAAPQVTLSATSAAFGSQATGTTSAARTVTLTNSGTAALTGIAITLGGTNPGDFVEGTNCGTTLAVAATCNIALEFKPAAAASFTAAVSIKDSATGSPQTIALSGTGTSTATGPKATLSATSAAFGSQATGTTSAAKTVTLTNSGTVALTGIAITLGGTNPGDFVEGTNCGTTLAAAATCNIALEFKPAAAASFTATVSIKDSATGSPQTIALSGTGTSTSGAKATLSATTAAFGSQATGTTSAARTVTLTNSGTVALTGIAITLGGTNPGDFVEGNNCGTTLAAAATCNIALEFKPAAAASFTATVSIKDSATGSPQTIALSGTGTSTATGAKATLSATTAAFGSVAVGTTSAAKTITLTNTGTATLSGITIALGGTNPGDFVEANKCTATLAVNASCAIALEFKAAAAGSFTATVAIKDNASGSPQTIALTGTGVASAVPVATLSATSAVFGNVASGTTSAAKTITLTNTGTTTLSGIVIALGGTNPSDFAEVNTCAATLAAKSNCVITLEFRPAAAATYQATVAIKDNAAGSPQTIALTGTGVAAGPKVTLSATAEAFGNQTIGTSSASRTVTVTNSGTAALTNLSVALAGTNPTAFAETNNCTATLAVNAACTITLAFKPTTAAAFSAAVDVKDNASGSPQTIALTGTGVQSTLANTIIAYAGSGIAGYSGDGGAATKAELYYGQGTAEDAEGNLYIADEGNNVVRKVTASTGIITTVAGNGYGAGMNPGGYAGDGGPATKAELGGPFGVTVDEAGNIYIADTYNSAIRKVTASTGIITTVAGNGTYGYAGDGGPATSAEISWPKSVALDTAGNIYISDGPNQVIRKVTVATGKISTIAGGGSGCSQQTDDYGDGCPALDANFEVSGEFSGTGGLTVDAKGNVYIADPDVETVRKITATTGIITVVAGDGYIASNGYGGYSGDGGPATKAELSNPRDVKVDGAGNIFIADAGNNVIREVAVSTGKIITIAGVNSSSGGVKELAPATSPTAVSFNGPDYISIDTAGNLFISDVNEFRVDKVYGAATPLPLNH